MENIIAYAIILGFCSLVLFGGIYLKKKFNLNQDDIDSVKLLLKAVEFVNSKISFKYNGELSKVLVYVFNAINFVESNETITDINQKIELVKQKATEICTENGITIDEQFNELLDTGIDFFLKEIKK